MEVNDIMALADGRKPAAEKVVPRGEYRIVNGIRYGEGQKIPAQKIAEVRNVN